LVKLASALQTKGFLEQETGLTFTSKKIGQLNQGLPTRGNSLKEEFKSLMGKWDHKLAD